MGVLFFFLLIIMIALQGMIMSLVTLSDGAFFLSHFTTFIMSNIPGLLHSLFFITDFLIRADEVS